MSIGILKLISYCARIQKIDFEKIIKERFQNYQKSLWFSCYATFYDNILLYMTAIRLLDVYEPVSLILPVCCPFDYFLSLIETITFLPFLFKFIRFQMLKTETSRGKVSSWEENIFQN